MKRPTIRKRENEPEKVSNGLVASIVKPLPEGSVTVRCIFLKLDKSEHTNGLYSVKFVPVGGSGIPREVLQRCALDEASAFFFASFFGNSNKVALDSFQKSTPLVAPMDEIELCLVTKCSKKDGRCFLNLHSMTKWVRPWKEAMLELPQQISTAGAFLLSSATIQDQLEVIKDEFPKPHVHLGFGEYQLRIWDDKCAQIGNFRDRAEWDRFYLDHPVPFFAVCELKSGGGVIEVLALQWDLQDYVTQFGVHPSSKALEKLGFKQSDAASPSAAIVLLRKDDPVPSGSTLYALPCPPGDITTDQQLLQELPKLDGCFYFAAPKTIKTTN